MDLTIVNDYKVIFDSLIFLMPIPLYTYISNIYDLSTAFNKFPDFFRMGI